MRTIESIAENEFGFSENLIVENVGVKGAMVLQEKFLSENYYGEIVVFVGKGNNGADGLAIARHLKLYGNSVRAFILYEREECTEECQRQIIMAEKFGVKISDISSTDPLLAYFTQAQENFFVIDAIFGTGVRLPLSNYVRDIVNLINQYSTVCVALDIATGVMGETGKIQGTAVKADITFAIGLPKIGHYVCQGPEHLGEMVILDAGFPDELMIGGDTTLLTRENVAKVLISRSEFAHKNTFGHTLLIGGSEGLTGALILASQASLAVGSGLVTSVTWEENYNELASRIKPEIMTAKIPANEGKALELLNNLSHYDSVVIGPGIGRSDRARQMVLNILSSFKGPLVIDADAINILDLKQDKELIRNREGVTLLTPHLGEFARLTGYSIDDVKETPLECISQLVDEIKCCVLLKGPSTYLAFPNGDIFVSYFPNEGMATGGSGDVLAGILGGMLAGRWSQIRDERYTTDEGLYEGVCLGAVVHSLAGGHASQKLSKRSMSAGSIVDFLAEAFQELENQANI